MTSFRHILMLMACLLQCLVKGPRFYVEGFTLFDFFTFSMACTEDKGYSFLQPHPLDCTRYYICSSGVLLPGQCPWGQVYNSYTHRCRLPTAWDFRKCSGQILASLDQGCSHNPALKVPSPQSCAQYFDCTKNPRSSGSKMQLMECPYPSLFSTTLSRCQAFDIVQCGQRPIPKAPCDYLQYRQLCDSPTCGPCSSRHPSCVGLPNGAHPVPNYANVYALCYSERTFDTRQCIPGHVFSTKTKNCVPSNSTVTSAP